MKDKIEITGHVDHGKTTLSAAFMDILGDKKDTKTIHEIIEEQNSIPYFAPQTIELTNWDIKDGRQNRRERRAKERKSNKK